MAYRNDFPRNLTSSKGTDVRRLVSLPPATGQKRFT